MIDQCTAFKRNGERCTLPSNGPDGLCWSHSPSNREKRVRMASRGGKAKANKEVKELKEAIKSLIDRVEKGQVEPTPANTMIRGYSCLLEFIKLERNVHIEEELAERIEALKNGQRQQSA